MHGPYICFLNKTFSLLVLLSGGFLYAGAGLFLSIFLGFQFTFRLKGGRQHGVSWLLALQTTAACSTFTSTANLLAGRDKIIIIYPRNAANCCPVMNEYSLHIFKTLPVFQICVLSLHKADRGIRAGKHELPRGVKPHGSFFISVYSLVPEMLCRIIWK